ncbi:Hint domain-containing protein [Pseudomonas poae]|uniref:Hint domain-containing protein n=1 Tax=Pseudomonas poae TaxID=200451 RepID=UPI00210B36D9|nr:Hint domain-containing protein [Pseudomonas poae]
MLTKYEEPCCFAAGTKVSTPNGDRAIESLKVGDVVWSSRKEAANPSPRRFWPPISVPTNRFTASN